jgi:predicted RNA-binding Zn ribbon-like protein
MSMPPENPPSRAESLPLVGGVLALDFCNTSSGRGTEGRLEHLHTAGNLLTWARHAAILDESKETHLRRLCEADPAFGARLLSRALHLRDALYRLDAALARGKTPDQADIDVLAEAHAACLGKGRLTTSDGGFGWTWTVEDTPEEVILGPIAASAMAVVTAADRARLKQCRGYHCGWLFLDTTKSNNRRWCEMEVCGNRAKQVRRRGRQQPGD